MEPRACMAGKHSTIELQPLLSFYFEIGSRYVTQVSWSSCLSLRSAGLTGVCYHAQLLLLSPFISHLKSPWDRLTWSQALQNPSIYRRSCHTNAWPHTDHALYVKKINDINHVCLLIKWDEIKWLNSLASDRSGYITKGSPSSQSCRGHLSALLIVLEAPVARFQKQKRHRKEY